ncbi:hemerythrin domain-containing protein [Magnetofaba australis]|uniref:hemerythrin domain-containing protein n=1 Tax=Magnetofaba australis TaxID=1472297 RepID=UPI000A19F0B4|nr:hemerythrin domain-containing protein [Magnetofaba australis]
MSDFALKRTGVESIDIQHEALFDLICILTDDVTQTDNAVSSLNEYVKFHFSYEESLMLPASYEHYTQHLKAHERFAAEMPRLTKQLMEETSIENKIEILDSMRKYLIDWLDNHINKTDAELFSNPSQFTPTR